MRTLREPFIVSVSGRDRPGLLAEIAGALADAGIDIVDVEQATLQDFLALSFLVDLREDPERSRRLLTGVIPRIGSLGLGVDLRALDADRIRLLQGAERMVLTVVTEEPSSRLVADLARLTALHGANIVSIRRLAEEDLRSGEYVLDVSGVPDRNALKRAVVLFAEEHGVDAGLAREDAYRKSKRLVVFDLDSTLVAAEVIDLLAERAGVAREVAAITARAMEGELDFTRALTERVALLTGLEERVLEEVASSLPLTPGAEETVQVLRGLGYRLGVLSGGFTFFAERIRERLQLDYAVANTLEIEGGRLTGRLLGPVLDGEGKARALREIAELERIPMDQVVGVGDGANDVPMLQAAGLGIAFRAREAVRRSADAAIQRTDFSGLLHLLGVSARDIRRSRERPHPLNP